MKEWWESKNQKSRKRRKGNAGYSFWDFILDIVLWLPELLFLPFRIAFWMLRGLFRLIIEWF